MPNPFMEGFGLGTDSQTKQNELQAKTDLGYWSTMQSLQNAQDLQQQTLLTDIAKHMTTSSAYGGFKMPEKVQQLEEKVPIERYAEEKYMELSRKDQQLKDAQANLKLAKTPEERDAAQTKIDELTLNISDLNNLMGNIGSARMEGKEDYGTGKFYEKKTPMPEYNPMDILWSDIANMRNKYRTFHGEDIYGKPLAFPNTQSMQNYFTPENVATYPFANAGYDYNRLYWGNPQYYNQRGMFPSNTTLLRNMSERIKQIQDYFKANYNTELTNEQAGKLIIQQGGGM